MQALARINTRLAELRGESPADAAADDGAATTTHAGQDQTMIAPKPIEVQEVR